MTQLEKLQKLSEALVGKTIIEVGFNWIKLSNGCVIYLEQSEIDSICD